MDKLLGSAWNMNQVLANLSTPAQVLESKQQLQATLTARLESLKDEIHLLTQLQSPTQHEAIPAAKAPEVEAMQRTGEQLERCSEMLSARPQCFAGSISPEKKQIEAAQSLAQALQYVLGRS